MNRELVTMRSESLGRDMDVLVYGSSGWPLVIFQPEGEMGGSFEDNGGLESIADFIDSGAVQVFSVDSADAEGWSARGGDNEARAKVVGDYYGFVFDELVPLVNERSDSGRRPLAAGFSMGATHALNAALRRPDLFQGCISLSGGYDASFFFGDWMNDELYLSSPVHFLPNTPADHPYLDLYRKRQFAVCTGQGAGEDESLRTQHMVEDAFRDLDVDAWFDYWGDDVSHDWGWWRKQLPYFLPFVLEDAEKTTADEAPAKKARRKAVTRKPAAKKAPAKKPAAKPAAKAAAKATTAKPTAKATAAKSEAKPTAKETAKKAPAKTTAKAEAATPAAKATAAKPEAKPTAKETAKKAPAKAEAKPATKATATKATAKAPAAKPTTAKAAAKTEAKAAAKPAATKPATTKTAAKPAAKKTRGSK